MDSNKEPRPRDLKTDLDSSCRHHWYIQPAIGPISEGMCQNCRQVRAFKNSIDYENDGTVRSKPSRSKVRGPMEALEGEV
jgi:hypothetical protein